MITTVKKIGHLAMLFGVMLSATSCLDTLLDINKNPLQPDDESLLKDGLIVGSFLPTLEESVIPVSTGGTEAVNAYQVSINLTGDAWAGYLSARDNKWHAGNTFSVFYFQENWCNNIYDYRVKNVLVPWRGIKQHTMDGTAKNEFAFSLAQIIKVAAFQRTTDAYGPIPYSQVGLGEFFVPYDSQEEVYKQLFAELDKAITVLSEYPGDKLLKDFDVVYEGDVNKWIKFANSLMLRMAVRVRYAAPDMAKMYAMKAVGQSKGLIENNDESAMMGSGAGLQMKNPLFTIGGSAYNDTRMGATICCYLKGYDDPRAAAYFLKSGFNNNSYDGVRTGILSSGSTYDNCSKVLVNEKDPVYWMHASEVDFLRAEAVLAKLITGSAASYYTSGIRKSFDERKVVGVDTYLNSEKQPAAYTDPRNAAMSAPAPSKVTVKWNEGANDEEKLEKIITQKYLAIFPDGHEAWTEWRRTGYPKQIPAKFNKSNVNVSTGDGYSGGVRRLIYPRNEYDHNNEHINQALKAWLGGTDFASTNVWWDKKVKN